MNEYHMKCGCIQHREALIKKKKLVCPDHPKHGVDYIIITCAECGKKIKCDPAKGAKKYCDDCAIIVSRVKNQESDERRRRGPERKLSWGVNGQLRPELYTRGWEYFLKSA